MVFKPINLARQSFVKTFTHGYAQSLVAASQSSTATQNTSFHTLGNNVASLFGKTAHPPVAQNAQQQNGTSSSNAAHTTKGVQHDVTSTDGGLAAYYAAWQRHRKGEDKELHQFQFAKRIGWKAPTTIPDARKSRDAVESVATSSRPLLAQSATTGTVEHDESKPQSTSSIQLSSDRQVEDNVAKSDLADTSVEKDVQESVSSTAAIDESEKPSSTASEPQVLSPENSTRPTSVSEGDAYISHLTLLAEQQQYGDIPAVFEAMLLAGVKPTSSAYNALLLAAINLPRGKHQVASTVLDVYSDMLNRRVLPDTSTYAIIVELLAARSLDVLAIQKDLKTKKLRYTALPGTDGFMLQSDEIESKILAEDDSLSIAIKLFDTSAAVTTNHVFPAETYRLLVTACAETGAIGDMVRIYADMESRSIVAPSAIFAPMISAFAAKGDLRSAVECYDEYKALAIAHNNNAGNVSMVRKDEEVYAAVVKAYATCQRTSGGLNFLSKLESSTSDEAALINIRNTVALQGLIPAWLAEDKHSSALEHAATRLSDQGLSAALSAITVDAADRNQVKVALDAFSSFSKLNQDAQNTTLPTLAILAMHIRQGSTEGVAETWTSLKAHTSTAAFVEPATMYAQFMMANGSVEHGLEEVGQMFTSIRSQTNAKAGAAEASDRIEEAVDLIASRLHDTKALSPKTTVQVLRLIAENDTMAMPIAEPLLASLGPQDVSTLAAEEVMFLAKFEANVLLSGPASDVAHAPRFAHALEVLITSGATFDFQTIRLFEEAASKIGRQDLASQLAGKSLPTPLTTPALSVRTLPASPYTSPTSAEDSFDPYGYTTDFRGSAAIGDELEKAYGRHSQHLSEALSRFRNMRRAGRHPRYITYAKLITAAAKENQLSTAEDILAMAKQDVPFLPQSRVVRQGWTAIWDSMVGACLTIGRRDVASAYHQSLIDIGAAPSANTFGLYITTLKDTAKTFDEATEAVKIFHQAKNEGVEPSSFLYNALIGKLGKARRIDDCLFYFAEMRQLGVRPTSVTYGTIVNALCRVSDDRFAEELFEEMESMPNYKPRPAPYNSLMQYFLTTKRDRSKVLAYYERMKASNIAPTMHTYKLLIDTYATLEPVNLPAAESILNEIKRTGGQPEAVHYASLIHAKGCVLHDLAGARAVFDSVLADNTVKPQACLYQALFESYVANHEVAATDSLLDKMKSQFVQMTPYIANTLIHGWAIAKDIARARSIFDSLGRDHREPSTYEAMIRANLAVEDHGNAMKVVGEALRRGYPSAVADKLAALVGGGGAGAGDEAQH